MTDYKISDKDGEILVSTARKIVTEFITVGRKFSLAKDIEERFSFDAGIFVTLNIKNDLRGCIGFVFPTKLSQALLDAAIAAATEDSRFPPVQTSELDKITFEVTVLTPPVQIQVDNPNTIPSKIKIGRDGLLIKQRYHSGLLLPQVPIEYGWSKEEFLDHTCQKAGLPSKCWRDEQSQIFSFEGIVFKEESPCGRIARANL